MTGVGVSDPLGIDRKRPPLRTYILVSKPSAGSNGEAVRE